jgi:hypothetical protein
MSGKPLPPPLVRPKSPPVDPSAGRTPPVPVRGWFPMFMVGDEARVCFTGAIYPVACGVKNQNPRASKTPVRLPQRPPVRSVEAQ